MLWLFSIMKAVEERPFVIPKEITKHINAGLPFMILKKLIKAVCYSITGMFFWFKGEMGRKTAVKW